MNLSSIISKQKAFFQTGATKKYANRMIALESFGRSNSSI